MFDVQTDCYIHACNSGGQKVLGIPSDISKTSDLLPPTPGQKMNFKQNGRKRVLFWAQHCRERGRLRDEPNDDKKKLSLGLGAESYVTITWKVFFSVVYRAMNGLCGEVRLALATLLFDSVRSGRLT